MHFSKEDQTWLPSALDAVAEACGSLVAGRADKFMNELAIRLRADAQPVENSRKEPVKQQSEQVNTARDKPEVNPNTESGALAEKLKIWLTGKGNK